VRQVVHLPGIIPRCTVNIM